MTPLLWAYPKNNLEVFIKILEAGADPNVQVTSDFGTECFIGFKEFYIGVGMSVTEKSATTRFPGYLKAVIKHGGDPNLVSKYHNMNNTPLHCVIDAVDSYDIYDIMESVEILLDAGADIDAVTYRNETPLVLAVRGGRYDVAILLVENGADWEIMPDGGFFTVVHDVISIKEDEFSFPTGEAEESYNKLVTLLKEKGADFDEARDDIKLFKSLFADPAKTTEGEYRRKQKESAQIREQLIKERHERYERKKRNGSAPMPFGSGPFFRRSLVVPLSCPVGVMRSRRVLRDVRGRNRRRRFPRRAA